MIADMTVSTLVTISEMKILRMPPHAVIYCQYGLRAYKPAFSAVANVSVAARQNQADEKHCDG